MKPLRTLLIAILALLYSGCTTATLEGVYKGGEGSFFDQLIFRSNHKVEVVFMGSTSEADYVMEADKVKITRAGETQILTLLKSGCLDGGGFIGKYCKD